MGANEWMWTVSLKTRELTYVFHISKRIKCSIFIFIYLFILYIVSKNKTILESGDS